MTNLWRTWLTVWCWAVALFGLVIAAGALPPGSGPNRALLEIMHGGPVGEAGQTLRFALALMGCVTLGWGLSLLATVRAAERLGGEGGRVWRLLTLSVLVWYPLASGFSVATGFALNAVSNTVLLVGYLVPVFATGVLGTPRRSATAPL